MNNSQRFPIDLFKLPGDTLSHVCLMSKFKKLLHLNVQSLSKSLQCIKRRIVIAYFNAAEMLGIDVNLF